MAANTSSSWRASVVVTTIGRGDFLPFYHQALCSEGLLDRVDMIVIPDRKTPAEVFGQCQQFAAKGMRVQCPSIAEQDEYMHKLELDGLVPYDTDNRRNIGFLMALEQGADMLVSIDDDNYCRPGEPFFGEHAVVLAPATTAVSLSSSNRWINICDLMEVEPRSVYPRGLPYRFRHQSPTIRRSTETGPVRMNAGLWLGEPDIDAITWLVSPARAVRVKGESILLGADTWSPINTQNTALHRDAVVAYYYILMNQPVGPGLNIDRYGDILSGYFCQACVRHLGDRVRVGSPTADHRRNSHNYLRDATNEMGGLAMIEELGPWLMDVKLAGRTYSETFLSLADALSSAAPHFKGFIWTDQSRAYIAKIADNMRRWTKTCRRWLQ